MNVPDLLAFSFVFLWLLLADLRGSWVPFNSVKGTEMGKMSNYSYVYIISKSLLPLRYFSSVNSNADCALRFLFKRSDEIATGIGEIALSAFLNAKVECP